MKAGSAASRVLWNFARLMRSPPRAPLTTEDARDAPPEHFVEKVADEGGDVYVVPMLEALFATLRARRSPTIENDPPVEPEQAKSVDGTGARP